MNGWFALLCTVMGAAIIPAGIGLYYLYGGRGPLDAAGLAAFTVAFTIIGFVIGIASISMKEDRCWH